MKNNTTLINSILSTYSINAYFKNIIPCGIVGRQVTSMDTIIQGQVEKSLVEQSFITNFSRVMGLHLENL